MWAAACDPAASCLAHYAVQPAPAHAAATGLQSPLFPSFGTPTLQDLALPLDRASDKRAAFLRRRWEAGGLAGGAAEGLTLWQHCAQPSAHNCSYHTSQKPCSNRLLPPTPAGARELRLAAALLPSETLQLDDAYHQALQLVEGAALGRGLGMQAAGQQADGSGSSGGAGGANSARQARGMRWVAGALARAIDERETRLRWACWAGRADAGPAAGASDRTLSLPAAALPCNASRLLHDSASSV